ncbi:hypothetical protein COCMIDRAFT_40509 [Bipolaris oryzae ATCC 44560]|uniref:Heterokaryon incompatibility domain-containing protein n=1 Tax=Bipolaris oryzae ATCC 44560 TaxID=930090 RepID=W6YUQ7_COCMI|nr:uncharacterized protein COCMIDRAFT_40509 [Bipolaris oryzae ATCC 44560]EUC41293.1 hypothetical protein COCMIDRAFT_40509 [Bipolaris oryzae ATCC 44560]
MRYHRYRPLQSNDSLRILTLHPSLKDSDPIACTIQHASLSDASLEYEALSYTWGDSNPTKKIELNGGREWQRVGENCYQALRHLRLRHEHRLVWIDAICINQRDMAERACQVRIMDKVFWRASNVLVYLGEHTPGSRVLFNELTAADELLRQTGGCDRPCPSEEIVQELQTFYQRPWFKRVWVLQEVFSKASVTIICGSSSVSFDALKELHFGYHSNHNVTDRAWPLPLKLIYLAPEHYSTTEFCLWNRLYESRNCLATDSRDKIFALKSLTGPGQSKMEHLIDYTQTAEQIFTNVAIFLLPVLGLRIFTAIHHPHKRNMPSWIPDWTQDDPLHFYYFVVESLEDTFDRAAPKLKSQDNRNHQIRPVLNEWSSEHLELSVTGCEYARIEETSKVFMFLDTNDAKNQIMALLSFLGDSESISGVDGKSNNCDTHKLHSHLSRFWSNVDPSESMSISDEDAGHFFNSLNQCRIGVMDNKELIIVPACAERENVVCILSGTDAPCLLRPDQFENWTLLTGDCHIFGDSFRVPSTVFFLCDEFIESHDNRVRDFRIR